VQIQDSSKGYIRHQHKSLSPHDGCEQYINWSNHSSLMLSKEIQ